VYPFLLQGVESANSLGCGFGREWVMSKEMERGEV